MSGLKQLLGGDVATSLGGLIQQFESGNADQVSRNASVRSTLLGVATSAAKNLL